MIVILPGRRLWPMIIVETVWHDTSERQESRRKDIADDSSHSHRWSHREIMHRSRSSISYDILHGIHSSANVSAMFAYLSYFPPPPPVIPGPPPHRAWTCSARSLSSSSCSASDDRNPASLRAYSPSIAHNRSVLPKNTSPVSPMATDDTNLSSLSGTAFDFLQNQFTFILLLVIFLTLVIFIILLLLLFVYFKRVRQRRSSSHSYRETHTNSNSNAESNVPRSPTDNANKTKRFYYSLIPHRRKYRTGTTTTAQASAMLTNPTEENHLLRSMNSDSAVVEVSLRSRSVTMPLQDDDDDQELEEEALWESRCCFLSVPVFFFFSLSPPQEKVENRDECQSTKKTNEQTLFSSRHTDVHRNQNKLFSDGNHQNGVRIAIVRPQRTTIVELIEKVAGSG